MLPSLSSSESFYPQMQVVFFLFPLYLVAIGLGGHKPCVQAFGADQFDAEHPDECKARSSFFNWWTYRHTIIQSDKRSPFVRIGRVFVAAIRNRRATLPAVVLDQETHGTLHHQSFQQLNFLNKALLAPNGSKEGETCSISEVEEAQAVLRLVPIWVTTLAYGIVFAQLSTFYTKQGATLNRKLFPGVDIPAATLQSFATLGIVVFSPIYDQIFVPLARVFTKKPSGITMLQRIGIGIFLSIIETVVAALVEMKRLRTAKEYGLVDMPDVTIPMSVWWLIPQYTLEGVSDVFTMVGLQEFFYDQVPTELRSMGIALYLCIFGVGSFLSSFLISVIEEATG
ncbi:protein NRT1/ PTR FAMILY 5.10-like [Quillaja saponaria]|uniref:Protein NRT1/ PTR FAMILY 5.10-like n=1 Tax=Quillaja saponaria TaxID=32244 RepID=A0AAD7P8K2_QUISA|nr:protein NRT1/ PTR FAMILY 5.10-like [Quillaja saponaria]